jgi:ABC-type Fe3+-hydroxamate transport system substrate-binding protein
LTEETTETLYRIGESHRIVGISGFTVRPPQARKEKPRVSAFTSAKIDRILDLNPDLVLGFSDLQADIARELIVAGVSVMVFNHRSVEGIFDMMSTLGALVGAPDKANILITECAVIRRTPDIIIGSWCGKKFRPEKVAQRVGWDMIPAVQNGALHEIKSADILQPGPAALTDGLAQLQNIIKKWHQSQSS